MIEQNIFRPSFYCIALNSDGHYLTAGGRNGRIYIWNMESGDLLTPYEGHKDRILLLSYNPANSDEMISYGRDGTVQIWSIATGHNIRTISGFAGRVIGISMTKDGTKVILIFENKLEVTYSAETGKVIAQKEYQNIDEAILENLRNKQGYLGYIAALIFSPDGKYLLVGSGADPPIVIWDLKYKNIKSTLNTSSYQIIYSNNGRLIAIYDRDGKLTIWDSGTFNKIYEQKFEFIYDIAFSKDDTLLAISTFSDLQIQILDLRNMEIVSSITINGERAYHLSFTGDNEVIAMVIEPGYIVQYVEYKTGKIKFEYIPPYDQTKYIVQIIDLEDDILSIFIATDNENNKLENRNVLSGELLQTFRGINDNYYPNMTYNPDKRVVVISYYYGMTFYDARNGTPIYIYDKDIGYINMAFSPDGNILAIGESTGKVILWDVSNMYSFFG